MAAAVERSSYTVEAIVRGVERQAQAMRWLVEEGQRIDAAAAPFMEPLLPMLRALEEAARKIPGEARATMTRRAHEALRAGATARARG